MNRTTKILFVVLLFISIVYGYAINIKGNWTNYLFSEGSLFEKIDFFSEQKEEYTENTALQMSTTSAAGNEIFKEDFEGATSSWTFVNGTYNGWHVGNAVNNGGSKSLYVSNDNGVTNGYGGSTAVNFAMSPAIVLPSGAIDGELRFDWRAQGEKLTTIYDYLEVWIVPSTFTPTAGTKLTATNAGGGILVKGEMVLNSTFVTEAKIVDLSQLTGSVKIVFQWANDTSGFYPPSAAVDNVSLSLFSCSSPGGVPVFSNVTTTTATVTWTGVTGVTNYEIYSDNKAVAPANSISGTAVNNATTHTYSNLSPAQGYFIWIRSICSATDKGAWKGPYVVKTLCGVIDVPRFFEGFETSSGSVSCWTIIDNNADSTSPTGSNIWRVYDYASGAYEGSKSLYFSGAYNINGIAHDDWAITPTIKMSAGKTYQLSYYYKTSSTTSYENFFEVRLSKAGTAIANFQTILVPSKKRVTGSYVKEVVFIQGTNDNVNLAWVVKPTTASYTYVYIDAVELKEVNCAYPLNLEVTSTTSSSASLKWNDVANSAWEYTIQKVGAGLPTTAGTQTQTTTPTATADSAGQPLQPNTEYEYYVRSKCSTGSHTDWEGPVKFRTGCLAFVAPFSEDFETTSPSFNCWNIVDVNKDASGTTNTWTTTTTANQGSRAMYFYGGYDIQHDDWLISPAVTLAGGFYKVSYFVRGSASYDNDMEVMYSTTGSDISSFTKTGTSKKIYKNGSYVEETFFVGGVVGDVHIGFHVMAKSYAYIYLDTFKIEKVDCTDPSLLNVSNVKSNSATLGWTDDLNSTWQYYLQEEGIGAPPTTGGTSTTNKSVVVTQDSQGNPLLPQTIYEYYLRSDCGSGDYGNWVGPFKFTTLCPISTLPFKEDFETTSTSVDCWTIVDGNQDATSPTGSNIWRLYNSASSANSGTYSMYFYAGGTKQHNDWLISPTFTFNAAKIYKLTYYQRATTTSSYDNMFSVKLSKTGIDPASFTTILVPATKYNNGTYVKREVYIKNTGGDVNIAWHAEGVTFGYIYLDDISIIETDCISPVDSDIKLDNVTFNSATFSWTDAEVSNTSYGYYVQPSGLPAPTGGGLSTTNKNITVTASNGGGGGALQPDTEYDFYIRSSCGASKYSPWVGPIKFRTLCANQAVPFWEGFNKNSTTLNCWTIVDNNKDATSFSGAWKTTTAQTFEGDQSMYFYGTSSTMKNDDWLISPTFNLVAGKFYRLKYNHVGYTFTSTLDYYKPEYEVYMSKTGVGITNFKDVVIPKQKLEYGAAWKEQNTIIRGYNGTINFGWHVSSVGYSYLYLDNIFVEEVACPEPKNLGVKDEKAHTVTLTWEEQFDGKEWEYYLQEDGAPAPVATSTGVKVSTQQATNVGVDAKGSTLKNNTAYEFYVRTVCGPGNVSIWVGPFKFMTACGVFTPPFNEGFDTSSISLRCWTILDSNGDATSATSNNIWKSSKERYKGNQAMEFIGSANVTHNDWLVSPTVKLDATKIYRLSYYYKGDVAKGEKNEVEIALSKTGTAASSFTTILKGKTEYATGKDWKQEKLFITGQSGDITVGLHVVSTGAAAIYIDEFAIEEVTNCPEPLELDVKDVKFDRATVSWTDAFGADRWEYFVQRAGNKAPRLNDRGTATKDNSVEVTRDNTSKQGLAGNTEYDFYVRTNCGDGTFSDWAGPFKFTTLCGVYLPPFMETYDTDSRSVNCWSAFDINNDFSNGANGWTISGSGPFEGDGHALFKGNATIVHDDWLVSPDLNLDNGTYILKYRYKASANENEFEVKLSNTGVAVNSFTTTLVSKRVYKNVQYKEEVVFFTAVKGVSNIGFHAVTTGVSNIYLDNVEIKKVETCAEPYNVEMTGQTGNSIDLKWEQFGTVSGWEVILVPYGDPVPTQPTTVYNVTGQPQTTITNVVGGTVYTVYVRAICDAEAKSHSDWSSGVMAYTKVGANDDCGGAIKVTATDNTLDECTNIFKGVTVGGTRSTVAVPSCWPSTYSSNANAMDIWFEFTPTNAYNVIKMQNVINLTTGNPLAQTFYFAIYEDANCNALTATKWCSTGISSTNLQGWEVRDMVPGKKYLIRVGYIPTGVDRHMYDLCIGSHNGKYLQVSASGTDYTVEELVKDVLVRSNCDLVSNVRYQNGDGSPKAMSYNTLGYFNRGETDFPFEDGIVLSTNEVQFVPGPVQNSSFDNRGSNNERWTGDKDINDAIDDAGGGPPNSTNKRVTQLEFDFIPIKENLKFDYLFASNSYHNDCSNVGCHAGALFAAWLVDTETGKGINLAKVNDTDMPIALNTVVDHARTGKSCVSLNPEFYWKHYQSATTRPGVNNRMGAPIDFVGLTTAMSSEEVKVIPGRKYHIKLAVIDFCATVAHSSAAFFKAGSFDLGDLDLGRDLTVENENAICNGESKTIYSGLGSENVTISWYKDDVLLPGKNTPDLEVTETGTYKVIGKYEDINCEVKGEVYAEIYPPISTVVARPANIELCRNSLTDQIVDISELGEGMFEKVPNVDDYFVEYYETEEDATYSDNEIKDITAYKVNFGDEMIISRFIKVEDKRTGCVEVFEYTIKKIAGDQPNKPQDVIVCDTYVLPELEENQHYYLGAGANGKEYFAGNILEAGEYDMYVLQDNGDGCYEEVSFRIVVTAMIPAAVFEDVHYECELYTLKELPEGNVYFMEFEGQRIPIPAGTEITITGTKIIVVSESENGVCYDESSFTIYYNDCPIPKGFSPNGDGLNDTFDLSNHGVTSIKVYNRNGIEVYSYGLGYKKQWDGKDKNGKELPSGTYYYVVNAFEKTRTGWVQINR